MRDTREAFFVLEGELTLRLEDGEHRVGPETWVFVPPEVVHTFAVTGDAPARFLDLHAPGSGYGDYVRGSTPPTRSSCSGPRGVRPAAAPIRRGDPGLVVIRRAGGVGGRDDHRPARSGVRPCSSRPTSSRSRSSTTAPASAEREPHVHRDHADAFLVVEGEFTFHLRDGSHALPAGTLLFFPPGVVHGFDNDERRGRPLLQLPHAVVRLRRLHARARTPTSTSTTRPPTAASIRRLAIAVRLSRLNGRRAIRAHRASREAPRKGTPSRPTARSSRCSRSRSSPGGGVEPHFHKGHSDSFYVLEGELEFHVGDEVVHATPGTYVLAPPNVVHWFRNVSDEPARMLNLHTPGGFVQYRRELRRRSARRASSRDDAFFERHDVFDV